MEFQQIISDIKAGKFAPIYLLHGDESFYNDKIEAALIEHSLTDMERAFNQTIAYGKDTDSTQLLDALRRYPMMAQRQLVVLREAQDMKTFDNLLSYVQKPIDSTLFVISYKHGKVKMNTKIGKALKTAALVHEAKAPYDNQMPVWIQNYCKEKGIKLDSPNAALLAEHLGNNLTRTANELDKLALNLPYGSSVSKSDIEKYIGISKDYNVFELCKAFAERDIKKVGQIRTHFAANMRKYNLVPTISALYNYFSKIYMLHGLQGQSDAALAKSLGLGNAWFLKEYKLAARNYPRAKTEEIISLLAEYDLRSKGVDYNSTTMGEEGLMTELFYRILH